jgi:hypothetical protein
MLSMEELEVVEKMLDYTLAREDTAPTGKRPLVANPAGLAADDMVAYPRMAARAQRSGVALDAQGNLFIADAGNSTIRKVSGGIISTIAGNGSFGFSRPGCVAFPIDIRNAQLSSIWCCYTEVDCCVRMEPA